MPSPTVDLSPGIRRWLGAGAWLPLAAWMAMIYWVSDQPDIPHAPEPWVDFLLKKLMHAAAYGILAWLWWRALARAGVRWPAAWALVWTLAYAAGDEWHQTFVPGRTGQARDVVVDAAGALAALAWLRRPRADDRRGAREVAGRWQ